MKGRSGLMTISPPIAPGQAARSSASASCPAAAPSAPRAPRPGAASRASILATRGSLGDLPSSVSSSSRRVSSGSPRRTKSSAGKGRMVSRVSGVTCVPKAIVRAPRALGQEDAVHVVAQRRRRHLGQVVLRALLLEQLLELGPAHARGDAVDDLDGVFGHQQGGQLRQARPAARSCSRGCAGPRGAGCGSRCRRPARAG